jgi:hypothetical protein
MLTGPAMSLYMCQNSKNNKFLQKFLASASATATTDTLSADFCYPFQDSIFDPNISPPEKKRPEIDARSFEDNLVRRIDGPMEEPKRFHRKTKHLTKRERKEKWTCRCNCSKHDPATEESLEDQAVIQELNRLCDDALRREQKKEDERDEAALAIDSLPPPLDTHRDEALVPCDGDDCVIAPWPSCRRVDEDVDGVVGREEGWCLIEHDVKVDVAKDLLQGVEGQAG